jgi:NAD(P)H-hydrate epimerase
MTLSLPVRVASAGEAVALDAETIAGGVPSRALMRVAGAHTAAVIAARYGDRLWNGVTVYTGPGNNGGDGWVIAGALARTGAPVHVCEVVPTKSADAIAERAAALPAVGLDEPSGGGIVIDAMLGTGARGRPRGSVAEAVARINTRRAQGDAIIAVDVPTGVDATTGAHEGCVQADLTVTFGTMKRGHLLARGACGTTVVVDIGLTGDGNASLPVMVDQPWVADRIPLIPFDAHKGIRKKLAVIAGGPGMGGAGILATQAALHSGLGMIQVVTHPANVGALQARIPEALTKTFPMDDGALQSLAKWADALLLGPGLEPTDETRTLIERLLRAFDGPVVMDAGALSVYTGKIDVLAAALDKRPAVITPHPLEFGRLAGVDVETVLAQRFDIAAEIAKQLHVAVLLKGTPTVVTAPDGARFVSATGTAALGTSGSGDTLSGIVATLLAQTCEPYAAAAAGAWVHGRAAELCDGVRGIALGDIAGNLPKVWRAIEAERRVRGGVRDEMPAADSDARPRYPVLVELRSVGNGW